MSNVFADISVKDPLICGSADVGVIVIVDTGVFDGDNEWSSDFPINLSSVSCRCGRLLALRDPFGEVPVFNVVVDEEEGVDNDDDDDDTFLCPDFTRRLMCEGWAAVAVGTMVEGVGDVTNDDSGDETDAADTIVTSVDDDDEADDASDADDSVPVAVVGVDDGMVTAGVDGVVVDSDIGDIGMI